MVLELFNKAKKVIVVILEIYIYNAKYDKIFINLLMAFCEALMVLFGPNDHQHGSWNQMRSSRT